MRATHTEVKYNIIFAMGTYKYTYNFKLSEMNKSAQD